MAEQKFPAPRPPRTSTPYRNAGVPAPPADDAPEIETCEPSEPPPPRDVFDELAHVEIDPRAVAERRSADRFWGFIFTVVGIGGLVMALGVDWVTIVDGERTPLKMMLSIHTFALCALGAGILKLRSRGTDDP